MNTATSVPGSFRDPAGRVFSLDGRIFRSVSEVGSSHYEASRDVLRELVTAGRLLGFEEVDPSLYGFDRADVTHLLEHPRLPIWSQPYEWSFSLLRDAALFHLHLHLDLLAKGFTLSDASAYNIQFLGPKPVFIDHLSIRPYVTGEFWKGHKQFCEQFLNPLLLRSYYDIAPNAWYRGALEGVPTDALAKLLPLTQRLNWNVLTNIILPARLQRGTVSRADVKFSVQNRQLPLVGLEAILRQLRNWISKLTPANRSESTWAKYASTTTYDDQETSDKKRFVAEFVQTTKPKTLIDLGCNTGEYSKVSLENGAGSVIGFDFDQQSLDTAHSRANVENMNFLPLYLDARNPSPSQGWMQVERQGFSERFKADAVLALAFEHHLAIAHNVPLDQVVKWITAVAPAGVIEFVPKPDPTIVKMLALRDDIFPDYTLDEFVRHLTLSSTIVRQKQVSKWGRTMFWYRRTV